jgi:AcrR family transcriptional regulator
VRQPSAKRQALLDAARRLGGDATVDELLAAAGAGIGTFYHHFPNGRADLRRALAADAAAEYEAGLLRVLQRNRDAETGVKALVHHHVRWAADHPTAAALLPVRPGAELHRATRAWCRSVGLELVRPDELLAVTLGPLRIVSSADRLAVAAWAAVEALERGG